MITARAPLAAAVLALALPAAASAATYTVDPAASGASCDAARTCKTISAAITAATAAGDVITVKDGTYTETPPAITTRNLTLKAETPGKAVLNGASTTAGDDVLTVGSGTTPTGAGDGARIQGLVISVPPNGGRAVRVNAQGVTIDQCSLARATASAGAAADAPVVGIDGTLANGTSFGRTTISRSILFQTTGTRGAIVQDDPSAAGASNGLSVVDSLVLAIKGPAVRMAGVEGAAIPDVVLRSQLLALDPAAVALQVDSLSGSTIKKLVSIDSSVLSGGAGTGAGLRAASQAAPVGPSGAGDIAITAVHATIVGAKNGVLLDAAANGRPEIPNVIPGQPPLQSGQAAGSIAASFVGSIVHGANAKTSFTPSTTAPGTANTATLDLGDADLDTPDALLFVNPAKRNLLLRVTAPVIDKVRAPVAGESDTDVSGDPRVVGAAADKGADELVDRAPKAVFATSTVDARAGQAIDFDAGASSDPDVGDSLTYRFDFGDGQTLETKEPRITHAYATAGLFTPRLTVVDALGTASDPLAGRAVKVRDANGPVVAIAIPKAGAKLKRFTTRTVTVKGKRKKLRSVRVLTFTGKASDPQGVTSVRLALLRGKPSGKTCAFLNFAQKAFKASSCGVPPLAIVKVVNGVWQFRLRTTTTYKPGAYTLIVGASDATGTAGTPATSAFTFT